MRAATVISLALVASVFALARPAAAAVPTVALFKAETLAMTADPAPAGTLNNLRATVVLAHAPGVTVTGMKANAKGATSGSYGAVQGTVHTLTGGSTYTVVDVAFSPGTGNWPGFDSTHTQFAKQACVRLNTSAGETADQCWNYQVGAEHETSAVDLPLPYDNYNTTQGAVLNASPAIFHVASACDDNDTGTSGWGQCDQAKLRLRNVATGQTRALLCGTDTTGSPSCEGRSGHPAGAFNADDNTRRDFDFSVAGLARGKWVIEALYGNEDNTYAHGATYDWSWLGYFSVNPTAPTVALAGSSSSGTFAHPDSDATVTYTAAVSSDAQILDWDLDQDTGNGFEVRERATVSYAANSGGVATLQAGQRSKPVDLTDLGSGVSCGIRAQVLDTGALAAVDTPADAVTRSSGIVSSACTTNKRPTGANIGPVAATAGGSPVPVALTHADGDNDPVTCEIVSLPSRGTLSGGKPGVACSRTYTADSSPSGPDSFTYRVKDDHHGSSPSYTVSIDVGEAPVLPSAPGIGAVAAGDSSASVSWSAPVSNGGADITAYVVTPFVNAVAQTPQTFNTTALTHVLTSLTNGTTYTFQVAAVNVAGTGPNSASSAAVTPGAQVGIPGAPTIGAVTPGNGQARLTWLAPSSNGGSAVNGYIVTPYVGAAAQAPQVFDSIATTQVVAGLTNGTTYTFRVAAKNLVGIGAESAESAAITPVVWLPFASADAFITQQFLDFADRAPTTAERSTWKAALTGGTKTPAELIDELRRAPYWEGTQASVIRLYSAYFKRAPDTSGLQFWITRRRSGNWTLSRISANFAGSSEFATKYGKLDAEAFVTLVYKNVLDRDPEPTGFAFWVKRLKAGTSRGSVMLSFSDSSEYIRHQANEVQVVTAYLGLLRRTPTQGEYDAAVARLDAAAPVTTITTIIAELLASAAYGARL
ncbi:MAG: hypothetical protein JWM89_1657 [Acidimicrobiales bacterium]|nr:hypothetical protein [Acidimicrobiales bacterium]